MRVRGVCAALLVLCLGGSTSTLTDAATFLDLTLTPDGSADPPGDLLELRVLYYPDDPELTVDVRAFRVVEEPAVDPDQATDRYGGAQPQRGVEGVGGEQGLHHYVAAAKWFQSLAARGKDHTRRSEGTCADGSGRSPSRARDDPLAMQDETRSADCQLRPGRNHC